MEWCEIIIVVLIVPVGAYIRGEVYELRRDYFYNGSWKERIGGRNKRCWYSESASHYCIFVFILINE
jgi:hypothetical protein